MSRNWRDYVISADGTHHVCDGRPAYATRFLNQSQGEMRRRIG